MENHLLGVSHILSSRLSALHTLNHLILTITIFHFHFHQVALLVKKPPANEGDMRDASCIPGSGRLPGGGHGNQLQHACLENPMDGGAWRVTVHGVTKNQTQLSD